MLIISFSLLIMSVFRDVHKIERKYGRTESRGCFVDVSGPACRASQFVMMRNPDNSPGANTVYLATSVDSTTRYHRGGFFNFNKTISAKCYVSCRNQSFVLLCKTMNIRSS